MFIVHVFVFCIAAVVIPAVCIFRRWRRSDVHVNWTHSILHHGQYCSLHDSLTDIAFCFRLLCGAWGLSLIVIFCIIVIHWRILTVIRVGQLIASREAKLFVIVRGHF